MPQKTIKGRCRKCGHVAPFHVPELNRREAAAARLEEQLRLREQALTAREAGYEKEVMLIRSCLHPDKQPADKEERYTRAYVAFDRLLESGKVAAQDDDDIPF